MAIAVIQNLKKVQFYYACQKLSSKDATSYVSFIYAQLQPELTFSSKVDRRKFTFSGL